MITCICRRRCLYPTFHCVPGIVLTYLKSVLFILLFILFIWASMKPFYMLKNSKNLVNDFMHGNSHLILFFPIFLIFIFLIDLFLNFFHFFYLLSVSFFYSLLSTFLIYEFHILVSHQNCLRVFQKSLINIYESFFNNFVHFVVFTIINCLVTYIY